MHVIDTAGLREAADEVERIGVARSWAEIEGADAVVFLHDLTRLGEAGYEAGDAAIAARLPAALVDAGARAPRLQQGRPAALGGRRPRAWCVSALTGEGLDALRARCSSSPAGRRRPRACSSRAPATCMRCNARASISSSPRRMPSAATAALDLLAEELRLAHDALGEITGAFTSDDLLGEIFSRFCIGK